MVVDRFYWSIDCFRHYRSFLVIILTNPNNRYGFSWSTCMGKHIRVLRDTIYPDRLCSYISRNGSLSESFISTLIAVLMIFPAGNTYYNRKVLIYRRLSVVLTMSILNSWNRLWASIINFPLLASKNHIKMRLQKLECTLVYHRRE